MDGVVIRPVSSPASDSGSSPPGAGGPREWWRRRGALLAIGGTVLVVAAVVLVLALGSGQGDGETAADAPAGGAAATTPGGGLLDLDTSVSTTAADGGAAAAPGESGSVGSDPGASPAAEPGAAGGSGGAAAVLVPRVGSYTFRGSGSEKNMPFLPTPVPQGPVKPASVADAGRGCWRLSIEQNSQHTDETTFCAGSDGSLTLQSIVVRQSNDLGGFGVVNSTLTTTCANPVVVVAPGMVPGAQFPLDCTVRTTANVPVADSSAAGTVTFVGMEPVTVGGAAVPAYHLHQEVRLTPGDGAPAGSRVSDIWVAADNGMVLRESRTMTASARLFGQVSTYVETSEHTLASR